MSCFRTPAWHGRNALQIAIPGAIDGTLQGFQCLKRLSGLPLRLPPVLATAYNAVLRPLALGALSASRAI